MELTRRRVWSEEKELRRRAELPDEHEPKVGLH